VCDLLIRRQFPQREFQDVPTLYGITLNTPGFPLPKRQSLVRVSLSLIYPDTSPPLQASQSTHPSTLDELRSHSQRSVTEIVTMTPPISTLNSCAIFVFPLPQRAYVCECIHYRPEQEHQ
jgi:hypothetical protein